MQFNVLGSVELQVAGEAVPLGGINQRATLGYLLLNADRAVATSTLVEALWGEAPPATARKMLQNAVSGLRARIAEAAGGASGVEVLTRAPGYQLRVSAEQVDLLRFQDLAERGRARLAEGEWAEAAELLRRGLALWRGPAFADLVEAGLDWPELVGLAKARLAAVEDRVEAELALGRHQEVLPELEAACEAEPARERMCGQLMLALYRSGRQTDALHVFRRTRTALLTEHGLDPGRELHELERAILHHDQGLLPTAVPTQAVPAQAIPAQAVPAQVGPDPVVARPVVTVAVDPPGTVSERKWVSVLLVRAQPAGPWDDDPEAVAERSRELAAVLEAEVGGLGGTLHGCLGAVWLAVFGMHRTYEDDAERAIRAAHAIRRRLADGVAGERRAHLGIAVATGEALVTTRPGGTPEVTGDVVDGCQQQLASVRAGEVRVCATSRLVSRGAVTYAPDGQVLAVRPEHESATFSGPFVGREGELDMLHRLVAQVRGSRSPQLVTLFGEPGIGKSRLVREFRTRLGDTARVVTGRNPRFGWNAPVTPLAGVLRECCGIAADADAPTAVRALTRTVHGLVSDVRTAEWMLSALRPLVELAEGARAPVAVEQVAPAWTRFVEEVAARGPLVVVLEDLQTADPTLLDLVEALDRRLGPVPLLLVATARTELVRRRPAWGGGRPTATSRTLGPLSDEEMRELLHQLDRRAPVGTAVPVLPGVCLADLVTSVAGNPLFASEHVLMLRADGDAGAPAFPTLTVRSADPTEQPPAVRLPQSVHTILAARLDTLSHKEKTVLQAAAVLGGRVWAEAVAGIGGAEREDTAAALRGLAELGFLRAVARRPDTGDLLYDFRHPLLRHVAHSQLRRQDRRSLRVRCAAWLRAHAEADPADPATGPAVVAAHPVLRSG